jgi:SP family sugar:H+ symporter-like MFS transporter
MGMFSRKKAPEANKIPDAHMGQINPSEKPTPAETPATLTPANNSQTSLPIQHNSNVAVAPEDALKKQPITMKAILLGAIASIGGFMFGYESGQISGRSSNHISCPVQ